MVETEATTHTNQTATIMAQQPQQHPPIQYNLVTPNASDASTQQGMFDTDANVKTMEMKA